MKKLLALCLTLMMTLCAAGALAQTFDLHTFQDGTKLALDFEGEVALSPREMENPEHIYFLAEAQGLAGVSISLAPSELNGGMNLKDLSQEEKMAYADKVGGIFMDPQISLEVTPSGNEFLRICSNEADDIDTIFTLYRGWTIELTQYHDDFHTLSQEDTDFMEKILHGLDFVNAD